MPVADLDLTGWTIAFDLDGTLIDTAPDLAASLNAVLAEQGLPPVSMDLARTLVGHGAKVMIERGYAATGIPLPPEATPRFVERFIEVYRARIAEESRPFPGCLEALEALEDAGAVLVVATNKRTDLAVAVIEALRMTRHFAAIVGADMAPAAKPDARHILFAIEEADGDPDMAIMIGDSATDVNGAKNAGVPVIAVSFGYTDVPATGLGADAIVDRYDDLLATVGRLVT
jgi:phosphoglycolate phosphatase